jgi:hypothetical protein
MTEKGRDRDLQVATCTLIERLRLSIVNQLMLHVVLIESADRLYKYNNIRAWIGVAVHVVAAM